MARRGRAFELSGPAAANLSGRVAESDQEGAQIRRAGARRGVDPSHVEGLVRVSDEIAEAGGARQPLGEPRLEEPSLPT